jgi:transposase-like protein
MQVAAVARKHGVTRWQVYDWRRRLRQGRLALPESMAPMFAPLMVEEASAPQRTMRPPKSTPAKVEVRRRRVPPLDIPRLGYAFDDVIYFVSTRAPGTAGDLNRAREK